MRSLEAKSEPDRDQKEEYSKEDEGEEDINENLDKPGKQDAGEGQASAEKADSLFSEKKDFMKGKRHDKPARKSRSIIAGVSASASKGKSAGKKY